MDSFRIGDGKQLLHSGIVFDELVHDPADVLLQGIHFTNVHADHDLAGLSLAVLRMATKLKQVMPVPVGDAGGEAMVAGDDVHGCFLCGL